MKLMIDGTKPSSHSIVVIKDGFREYANRYLVYDDLRWDCPLFLNYKENQNNEDFIKRHLSSELKVSFDTIKLTYVSHRIHEKFSVSAQENKLYSHKFYLATMDEYPAFMQEDSFKCDGTVYHWRTITELEQDQKVQQKNMDIVRYVKELF